MPKIPCTSAIPWQDVAQGLVDDLDETVIIPLVVNALVSLPEHVRRVAIANALLKGV